MTTIAGLVKELNGLAESHDEYNIDLESIVNRLESDCGDVGEWCDYLDGYDFQENHSCEIIYYANAIKFLKENDAGLKLSLELASDLGYAAKDLNSEILASLLLTELAHETFTNFCSDAKYLIDEYLHELEEGE